MDFKKGDRAIIRKGYNKFYSLEVEGNAAWLPYEDLQEGCEVICIGEIDTDGTIRVCAASARGLTTSIPVHFLAKLAPMVS